MTSQELLDKITEIRVTRYETNQDFALALGIFREEANKAGSFVLAQPKAEEARKIYYRLVDRLQDGCGENEYRTINREYQLRSGF